MAPRRKVGVLSGSEIQSKKLISVNFKSESLKSASYDLRLGDEYYIPSFSKNEDVAQDTLLHISKCSLNNDVLVLKPFASIVFSTEEILTLPDNIVGRFDMRIKFAMQGLVLQVGPQVEPNYSGRLFGLLLNFSNKTISIPRGARLLTIEFSYFRKKCSEPRTKKEPVDSLAGFLKDRQLVVGTLEAFLSKINEKHEEIKNLSVNMENSRKSFWNRLFSIILVIWTLIFTALIPYLTLWISKTTIDKDDYPFERIIRLEGQRDSLQNMNAAIQNDIRSLKEQVEKLSKANQESSKEKHQ